MCEEDKKPYHSDKQGAVVEFLAVCDPEDDILIHRNNIIVDRDDPKNLILYRGSRLFKQAHWKHFAIERPAFESSLEEVPNEFPKQAEQWSDASQNWDCLRPLWLALSEIGEENIFHANVYTVEQSVDFLEPVVSTPLATNHMQWPWWGASGLGGNTYYCIFSESHRWAIFSDVDFCCVVGGEPEFIASVIARSGGDAFLRDRFDARWGALKGQMTADLQSYARNIYTCCGWSAPTFLSS